MQTKSLSQKCYLCQNRLATAGMGICIFGIWDTLKIFLGLAFNFSELSTIFDEVTEYAWVAYIIFGIALLSVTAFLLLTSQYIGIFAIKYAKSPSPRLHIMPILASLLMIGILIYSIYYYSQEVFAKQQHYLTSIIDAFTELIYIIALIEVCIGTISYPYLIKKREE